MSRIDWAFVNAAILEDPRLLQVGRSERLLHVEATVWACEHHTDGFIPSNALPRLTDHRRYREAAKALVATGLWASGWQAQPLPGPSAEEARSTNPERAGAGYGPTEDGFYLMDFLDYQLAAERVEKEREAARLRQERRRDYAIKKQVGSDV